MRWSVPRIWNGTAYILGGGPSLNDVDLSPLHDRRVVGANNAYLLGNWVDVVFFGDCGWYDKHKEALTLFSGLKVTCCDKAVNEPGVKFLPRGHTGYEKRPDYCGWNSNSGAGASNLAAQLGATRIVLVGFDMKPRGVYCNWHTDHANGVLRKEGDVAIQQTYGRFLKYWKMLYDGLKQVGIDVVNTTKDSAMRFVPYSPYEEETK